MNQQKSQDNRELGGGDLGIGKDELGQGSSMGRGGAGGLLSPGVGGWWPPPKLINLHLHPLHLCQELLLGGGNWRYQVRICSAPEEQRLPAWLIPSPTSAGCISLVGALPAYPCRPLLTLLSSSSS